jgi:hypothetical protein
VFGFRVTRDQFSVAFCRRLLELIVYPCGNTASRAELAIGPPVEQGSGAWAGPIGDADSRGDWPSVRGPGTRRTSCGDPEESIKVVVMDTRSGRSGGHKLKGPLECKRHNPSLECLGPRPGGWRYG